MFQCVETVIEARGTHSPTWSGKSLILAVKASDGQEPESFNVSLWRQRSGGDPVSLEEILSQKVKDVGSTVAVMNEMEPLHWKQLNGRDILEIVTKGYISYIPHNIGRINSTSGASPGENVALLQWSERKGEVLVKSTALNFETLDQLFKLSKPPVYASVKWDNDLSTLLGCKGWVIWLCSVNPIALLHGKSSTRIYYIIIHSVSVCHGQSHVNIFTFISTSVSLLPPFLVLFLNGWGNFFSIFCLPPIFWPFLITLLI